MFGFVSYSTLFFSLFFKSEKLNNGNWLYLNGVRSKTGNVWQRNTYISWQAGKSLSSVSVLGHGKVTTFHVFYTIIRRQQPNVKDS